MPSSPEEDERRVVFGLRLKRARAQARLSQRALAAKAGMNQSYLAEVELGRHSISLDRIYALADALDVLAADLVGGDQPET